MANQDRIVALTLSAQERMFRLAARDCGLSLKCISLESNIPYNTIRSYAGHNESPTMMPLSAVNKLTGVIPDELLSHLFEPVDRHIAANGPDDLNYDALGEAAHDLAGEVAKSRRPDSPGGTNIVPLEQQAIKAKHRKLGRAAA